MLDRRASIFSFSSLIFYRRQRKPKSGANDIDNSVEVGARMKRDCCERLGRCPIHLKEGLTREWRSEWDWNRLHAGAINKLLILLRLDSSASRRSSRHYVVPSAQASRRRRGYLIKEAPIRFSCPYGTAAARAGMAHMRILIEPSLLGRRTEADARCHRGIRRYRTGPINRRGSTSSSRTRSWRNDHMPPKLTPGTAQSFRARNIVCRSSLRPCRRNHYREVDA